MKKNKSTSELAAELESLKARTKEVSKLLMQRKREEKVAAAKAAHDTKIAEALAMLKWSETVRLNNGQTIREIFELWRAQQRDPDESATEVANPSVQ